MKKSFTLAGLAVLAAAPVAAYADDGLDYNVGAVSDSRYRGISQTRLKPALQGGLDYTRDAFYVGAWLSMVKWIKDNGVKGSVEVDVYGGYKGELAKDVAFDVGAIRYEYFGNKLADTGIYSNANTTEIYGALNYGPVSTKLSYALTDSFGNKNSDGSYYFDLSATFDVAGISLVPHLGYQKIVNTPGASYTDYSLTASKEVIKGVTLSLAAVGTNASRTFYAPGAAANSTKFLGRSALVLGVKYTF